MHPTIAVKLVLINTLFVYVTEKSVNISRKYQDKMEKLSKILDKLLYFIGKLQT